MVDAVSTEVRRGDLQEKLDRVRASAHRAQAAEKGPYRPEWCPPRPPAGPMPDFPEDRKWWTR